MAFEIGLAKAKDKRIIPVLVEKVALPSEVEGLVYVDMCRDKKQGIEEVVSVVT